MEAIRTNAVGADNVMNVAINAGVRRVVVLSTDKAAYPINAMGMSKALMEKLMVARSRVAAERGCILSGTRYGNVMASRGSVIPLFLEQIASGKPLTVTNPEMTRFMMSIENAVELVLYAFEHAAPGDLFVQKAPAATIGTLAEAMLRLFDAPHGVRELGIRHGEKLYETLLTREEMARADDLGGYYRVHPDGRDLNYEAFFSEGQPKAAEAQEYHSHNTERLDVEQMMEVLRGLPVVREALRKHHGVTAPAAGTAPRREAASVG
jgi:UDP-glucose 4-epimerase